MTADDLTRRDPALLRRAIIAAHDAECEEGAECKSADHTTQRGRRSYYLRPGEAAIAEVWRADRQEYYELAEEGQGVAAAACEDRDTAIARAERVEAEHEAFLRNLDDAFGLEDGEESRYSNPEGSAESIYLDVARAYKRHVDAVRRVRHVIADWSPRARRKIETALDGTE